MRTHTHTRPQASTIQCVPGKAASVPRCCLCRGAGCSPETLQGAAEPPRHSAPSVVAGGTNHHMNQQVCVCVCGGEGKEQSGDWKANLRTRPHMPAWPIYHSPTNPPSPGRIAGPALLARAPCGTSQTRACPPDRPPVAADQPDSPARGSCGQRPPAPFLSLQTQSIKRKVRECVSMSVSASVSVSVSVSVCLCLCVCLCERHTCTHTHTHTHTLTHSLSPSHTQTHTLCLRLC